MRFLFVMDPAEKMLPDKDTSFALMRAAQARSHLCYHCLPAEISHRGREVRARARELRVSDAPPHLEWLGGADLDLAELDGVLIRKDPPFDVDYLHLTQQLDLVTDRTQVVNAPRGLRDANEKLFAFHFADLMPPSLVSSDRAALRAFIDEVGGEAILKPLDGAGGQGVVAVSSTDRNTRALLDLHTAEGRQPALVQQYLPAARDGDKRVLLLAGRPLGAIRRVPRADDLRANIHVGGQVQATTLTPAEQALVDRVGPVLCEHGLFFVGLDLIDERLIEVNVTSPTGIQELGRLTGTAPELAVIAWLEERAR